MLAHTPDQADGSSSAEVCIIDLIAAADHQPQQSVKYVLSEGPGGYLMRVFSMESRHIDIWDSTRRIRPQHKLVSAGFIMDWNPTQDEWTLQECECYGESTTIGIRSRPKLDTALLQDNASHQMLRAFFRPGRDFSPCVPVSTR